MRPGIDAFKDVFTAGDDLKDGSLGSELDNPGRPSTPAIKACGEGREGGQPGLHSGTGFINGTIAYGHPHGGRAAVIVRRAVPQPVVVQGVPARISGIHTAKTSRRIGLDGAFISNFSSPPKGEVSVLWLQQSGGGATCPMAA